MSDSTTVLLSGGIDSSALLSFHANRGDDVTALHVSYGQPSEAAERRAARAVASSLGVPLQEVGLHGITVPLPGEIPGRNALLLLIAFMAQSHRSALVSIGIHAGSAYSDCSPQFMREMQDVYDLYSGGRVRAIAPFVTWHKSEVTELARANGVPLHLTFSCDSGGDDACGTCPSCKDRAEVGC